MYSLTYLEEIYMGKKQYLFLTAVASLTLLTACNNHEVSHSNNSHQTSKKATALNDAKMDVDGLFSDSKHTKLLDGTTEDDIDSVDIEVASLKKSEGKSELQKEVKKAKALWPDFKKKLDRNAATSSLKAEKDRKEAESNSLEESKSESKASESVQSESIAKAQSESVKAKEDSKSEEQKTADRLDKNVLFGYLNKNKATSISSSYYQSDEFDYAYFGVGDHNIIKSVKLDFKDIPLMDKEEAVEYVQSFTADDATKVSARDNESDYFHSNKTGLNYMVKYTTNDDGISLVLIYPKQ